MIHSTLSGLTLNIALIVGVRERGGLGACFDASGGTSGSGDNLEVIRC